MPDPGPRRPLFVEHRIRSTAPPAAARPVVGGGTAALALPAVLVLSRSGDPDLAAVVALLAAAGVPAVRLDADAAGAPVPVVDVVAGAVGVGGGWVSPTVVWTRHFHGRPTTDDPFAVGAWRALAGALAVIARTDVAPAPGGQIAQLRAAQRLGIAVPRTVVTVDVAAAAAALSGDRVVVKELGGHFAEPVPGELIGRFPTVVARTALCRAAPVGHPVVVQEFVEHDVELRVYHLDGAVHAFAVEKAAAADPWTAPDRVRVAAVEPPADVVAAARAVASALSLRYGAFDFLVGRAGPVFLEVNTEGDWGWVERGAGLGNVVTAGVARMLADLHRAALPAGRPPRLDLPSFLLARG